MGHLRRLVHDERLTHRWASDTVLPLINHALATSPNAELGGLSPAELKFGTADLARFKLPPPLLPGADYSAIIHRLNENLAIVRSITNSFQEQLRSQRTTAHFPHNKFQPGDKILWNPREQPTSLRSSKLAPKLLGPYTVILQTKNDVLCEHIITNKRMTFHADRITLFVSTDNDARKAGLLDREEYVITQILSDNKKFNNKNQLKFLVQWEGYGPNDNSWEPYSELKLTTQLHAYLCKVGQSHLIPPNI